MHLSGSVAMKQGSLVVFLLLATVPSFSQSHSPTAAPETTSPDVNVILQSLEHVEQRNPALSRSYEVTRQYKVFRADNKQPTAEVSAQISFTPPSTKTFKITQASGNPRGEKIVRSILELEIKNTREGHNSDISRMNYDFVFLRQENFGLLPEYVLRIIPKRKQKDLILGQIWVDANTLRVRRIEGVLAKSPSLWVKDVHLTLQFAEVNGIWISVSVDAIATVRLLGRYTLAGLYVPAPNPASVAPSR
jgi:hypothetical protein